MENPKWVLKENRKFKSKIFCKTKNFDFIWKFEANPESGRYMCIFLSYFYIYYIFTVRLCVSWLFRWFLAPPRGVAAAAGVWGGASVVSSDPCRRQQWAGRRRRTDLWSNRTTPSQHGPWLHAVQVKPAPSTCLSFYLSSCVSLWPLCMCLGLTWTCWRLSSSATCSGSSSPSSSLLGPPGEWWGHTYLRTLFLPIYIYLYLLYFFKVKFPLYVTS